MEKLNKRIIKQNIKPILILIFFIAITPLSAQNTNYFGSQINLGILPVINRTDLISVGPVSNQMGKNVLFSAKQLNRFTIKNILSETIKNPSDTTELNKIAVKTNSHYLISGEITKNDNFYILTLFLYNVRSGKIEVLKNEEFYNIKESLRASFRLCYPLFEVLTGTHINRGIVNINNQTPDKNFVVEINGEKLGENIFSVILPEGEYEIRISPAGQNGEDSYSENVEIEEGELIQVRFSIFRKDEKRPNRFSKKNTFRLSPLGSMLIMTKFTGAEKFSWEMPILTIPEISYSRLISDDIGVNIALGLVFPIFSLNPAGSIGFEIKAGPNFRLGRVSLIPMVGYSMLFTSSDVSEYTLIDFANKKTPENTYDSPSLLQAVTVVLGFEFFFNPYSSIYGESGFVIGYKERLDIDQDETYQSGLSVGIVFSLGTGISF